MNACRVWPQSSRLPADFYDPVRTSVAALIVTGSLDPATNNSTSSCRSIGQVLTKRDERLRELLRGELR